MSGTALCCQVIHYDVRYCVYAAKYCITLSAVALHCQVLHYAAKYRITLLTTVPRCQVQHYSAKHCTSLQGIVLRYQVLHRYPMTAGAPELWGYRGLTSHYRKSPTTGSCTPLQGNYSLIQGITTVYLQVADVMSAASRLLSSKSSQYAIDHRSQCMP